MIFEIRRLLLLVVVSFVRDRRFCVVAAAADEGNRGSNDVEVLVDPKLVSGDINVLVLTDVHSWVAGHGRQEPNFDADYGDVLSFYERLKTYFDRNDHDFWFVSNGDFVDGTGLSAPGDPSSLVPIIEKLPFDVVNCGNHELYEDSNVNYMTRPGGWVDWWGERYLTANIKLAKSNKKEQEESPNSGSSRLLGNPFRLLKGKHSNLLVFGFLYNMEGASSLIEIERVEEAVNSTWFQDAIIQNEEQVDAILVLAHMDLKDPLVDVILTALRKLVGHDMPIQFLTGHTHYRGETRLDEWAVSLEAGRYLDTVGFVSFPTKSTVTSIHNWTRAEKNNTLFQSFFIEGSKRGLVETLGLDDVNQLPTENGKELSEMIHRTRQEMGLLEEIGCAPRDYIINASVDAKDSLWGLYRDEVVPKAFFASREKNNSVMFVQNEAWRYTLLSHAPLIVDDIKAVAPFNDTIVHIGSLPGSVIFQLNTTMNKVPSFLSALPNYILIGNVEDNEKYHLYTHNFHKDEILQELAKLLPKETFMTTNTNVSSTMLWLSFVRDNWHCHNTKDSTLMPDWVFTPDSIAAMTQLQRL